MGDDRVNRFQGDPEEPILLGSTVAPEATESGVSLRQFDSESSSGESTVGPAPRVVFNRTLEHEKLQAAGGYQPIAELGRGGMGVAFLAYRLGREPLDWAVVKRPHRHLMQDAEIHRRFHHEAAIATTVSHPCLVQTWGAGEDAHGPYLLLEYVHGTTLEDLIDRAALRGETLPRAAVLEIGLSCLSALEALHEAKDRHGAPLYIVHRDVSPQNVLVSLEGKGKLSDLGVAKSRLRHASTDARDLLGKLPFLAPEYLKERRTGPALDVYAWGVTLWMALTGRSPFTSKRERGLLYEILEQGVPELPIPEGQWSQELRAICASATHRDWKQRASTSQLRRELTVLLAARSPRFDESLMSVVDRLAGNDLRRRDEIWGLGLDPKVSESGRLSTWGARIMSWVGGTTETKVSVAPRKISNGGD